MPAGRAVVAVVVLLAAAATAAHAATCDGPEYRVSTSKEVFVLCASKRSGGCGDDGSCTGCMDLEWTAEGSLEDVDAVAFSMGEAHGQCTTACGVRVSGNHNGSVVHGSVIVSMSTATEASAEGLSVGFGLCTAADGSMADDVQVSVRRTSGQVEVATRGSPSTEAPTATTLQGTTSAASTASAAHGQRQLRTIAEWSPWDLMPWDDFSFAFPQDPWPVVDTRRDSWPLPECPSAQCERRCLASAHCQNPTWCVQCRVNCAAAAPVRRMSAVAAAEPKSAPGSRALLSIQRSSDGFVPVPAWQPFPVPSWPTLPLPQPSPVTPPRRDTWPLRECPSAGCERRCLANAQCQSPVWCDECRAKCAYQNPAETAHAAFTSPQSACPMSACEQRCLSSSRCRNRDWCQSCRLACPKSPSGQACPVAASVPVQATAVCTGANCNCTAVCQAFPQCKDPTWCKTCMDACNADSCRVIR